MLNRKIKEDLKKKGREGKGRLPRPEKRLKKRRKTNG
jgi:hypothetical protein